MKHLAFIFILSVLCSQWANAQVKFGLRTGIAPNHIDAGDVTVSTIDDSIKYSITNTGPELAFSALFEVAGWPLFVQGAILAGGSYISYDKDDLLQPSATIRNTRELEYQLDVPVEVGLQYQGFFATGGVMWTGHFIDEEQSILLSDTFTELFKKQYAYKFGIGYDFDWQATLELSYSYYPDVESRIVLDGTVDYNFLIERHFVMVNFSWNFIRAGWK